MLNIQNLTKRYGSKTAVDNLSLSIEAGEICAFIGHNGAGKTTTLKACCGLLTPDSGEITVDGMSIREKPIDCKRVMAYIPDNPDMYEFLTGYEYLNFVADVYGVTKEDREKRIAELGALLGITDALGGAISECSHGMKQKIAIISALIHKPKLILMDEPFVGLDPVASHQLKNLMAEHCANGGAIFFSTHVLEVAEKLCNKVAIIKNGKLVASGAMDDVRGDSSLEEIFLELEEEKAQ
ncbi:MAG: ABC transporter ATP-binding protein [Acutalibacteraceae bacterium]|jgi:ABC-2 type transport system ATP-binding protein|nr:ABC transporter ATP-binding protein [Acutalibacteraceae bacterium]HJB61616.1 ABC transporter ATP-binding protein [Candidatus Ruminococcus gallistercoris]